MEALESRQLLAAVFWDGGAGTNNWNDAANWNRGGADMLPQNGDDVTISVAANPTVNFNVGSTVTLASLISDEALTVSSGTLALQVGGTADINAVLSLMAGSLAGGSWDVSGGTLRGTSSGGTITDAAITGDILLDSTSASVRVSGATRFTAARLTANAATLQMAPGYTLMDLVVAEGAATGNRNVTGAVGGTGTVTIAPSAVIRLAAGCGGGLTFNNSSVATFINNGLISAEAAGRTLNFNNTTLTNNATLQVLAGTLDISPTNFMNTATGTVSVASGATLVIAGNWSNAGTITSSGGMVNLGGAFSSLGTFNRTGGTVNLTGTFTNGGTFTFTASTGSWNLLGGTISGGTLVFNGADRLAFTSSAGNLADVQVTGDLLLDSTSATARVSGTTRFTAARLTANAATLQMAPGYTLMDLVVAEGATTGTRNITGAVGGSGTVTIAPSAVIRLAAGCGGGLTFNNSSVATFINNGLISAEATGRTLNFNNTTLTNNATIQVLAGSLDISPTNFMNTATGTVSVASGATLAIAGNWSNAGTITSSGGMVNFGGTFTSVGTFNRTDGTVNLTGTFNNGGTFTFTASTGSWNLLGGTVSGGTLVFNGADRLVFTSSGGNLADVQVTGDLLLDSTSATVRVSGTTRFTAARLTANAATLQMAPGYTLMDLVVAEGATTGTRNITGAVGGSGTVTIAPSAVIRLAAGCGGGLTFNNSSVATFINNGLITAEAAGRTLNFNNTTLTNNATLQVLAGTLDISPTNFSNELSGSVTAVSGTTVSISGNWMNLGTITVTDATLNLGGAFTLGAAGVINRTGGTVNLVGTLNNTGTTFIFDASTGPWNLLGGTVNGGTLVFNGANRLVLTSSGGGLSDVIVNGELLLETTSATVRVSGATRFTAARLTANAATLQLAPAYTLMDLVVAEGATTGTRGITGAVGGTGTATIAPGAVIRLAAGCGGGLNFNNSSPATFINNGLISAEAAGRTLNFNNTTLTNNATIQVLAGTMDISPTNFMNTATGTVSVESGASVTIAGAWSSVGTFVSNGGTMNLGGTFTSVGTFNRTGGTVNLTGTFNNGGTFTFTASTGSWNLLGGTISGGTLVFDGADRLVFTSSAGNLADVQVNGELLLDSTSATVRVSGTTRFTAARLTANAATLQMAPGYTLMDLVVAEGATTGTRHVTGAVGGTGTLTIGPTGSIRVAAGSGGGLGINNSSPTTLTNNGVIAVEANGRTLSINVTAVTNINGSELNGGTWISTGTAALTFNGTPVLTTNNANVTVGGSTSAGGATSFPAFATLSVNNGSFSTGGEGTYTITPAGGTLVNNGTLTLGPGNTLAVTGDFAMSATATMTVQIQSTMQTGIGRLAVSGTATLDGTLNIVPVNGWSPTCVNVNFITAGTLMDQFAVQNLPVPPSPLTSFVAYIGEVRFAISRPSDFNRDGFLNSQDFFDFLNVFFALDPQGDFNHDGFINSQDFFDFISDFFTPCP